MKKAKVDNSGAEAAAKAQAEAQAVANNLQRNFQTDLKTENLTQVVPGQVEEMGVDATGVRKKRTGSGLSSQLGINV